MVTEQRETKLVPQQIFSSSRAYANDREVAFAEKIGAVDLLDMSFIAKVHKFGGKGKKLSHNGRTALTIEFDNYQNSYQDSYVLNYAQFPKTHKKSDEEMEVLEESQLSSNSPAVLFYEQDKDTDEGTLAQNLSKLQGKTDKEIWVVLEAESKRVIEKIEIALSLGVKNFILRAGKYDNEYFWNTQVIGNIQENGGTIIVALPRKRHVKNSYMKFFFRFGVDGTFHEVPERGWGSEILHLNSNFEYVSMSLQKALEGYSQVADNITKSSHYGFSRVRALNVANTFAGTIEVLQVMEEA